MRVTDIGQKSEERKRDRVVYREIVRTTRNKETFRECLEQAVNEENRARRS